MINKSSRSAKLKFAYWLGAVLLELIFWQVAAIIISATIILGLVLDLALLISLAYH